MLKINSHLDSKIVALSDEMETKLIMQALDRRVSNVTLTTSRIPLLFLFHKGYVRDNGNEIVFRRIVHIIFFFKIRRNPHCYAHLSKSS